MRYFIPGELFNTIEVPKSDTSLVSVSPLINDMAYSLPQASDVLVRKELWKSVCDWTDRSGTLIDRITGIISSSSLSIPLDSTVGDVRYIVGIVYNGNAISYKSVSIANTQNGLSINFYGMGVPTSDVNVEVLVSVNAKPDVAVADQKLPSWYLKKYREVIVHGALYRMLGMDNKPWTNASNAAMHATSYLANLKKMSVGYITSGMRKDVMVGMESILARKSTTTQSSSQTQTVG